MVTDPRWQSEWRGIVLAEAAEKGSWPNYARARPLGNIGHRAYFLGGFTFCGRFIDTVSTGPIRTALGWNCRRCRRLARAAEAASRAWEARPGNSRTW
jgi:hypothetical protein